MHNSFGLSKTSFGYKILKKHGWKEGFGLGKMESGLLHPISYCSNVTSYASHGRRGLGYKDEGIERALISDQSEKLFQCFVANAIVLKDLVFSKEFLSGERDVIHHVAEKYSLSHSSLGSGENRHLVVRYKFSIHELVLQLKQVGGSAGRYSLIEPSFKTSEFPFLI